VRRERGSVILLLVLLACMSGCGTMETRLVSIFGSTSGPALKAREREHDFASALGYLRKGDDEQARTALERVVVAPPHAGVTDEALFRLAVLSLGNEGTKGATRAKALLDRLKSEFPDSIWTYQAGPLVTYLANGKHVRDREIRSLRELNLSLSRDNKELRQSIERLKSLDMELEQKIRR